MFQTVSELLKIPFQKEDIPFLKEYKGGYILDIETGQIKQSRVLIDFVFGENYRKTIHYRLKQISHEEIQ